MSGIYLSVWDEKFDDKVLLPTKGGWPHITLVYSGKNLTPDVLKPLACNVFTTYVLTNITLTQAYVNSFRLGDGTWRHDCLIKLSDSDEELIEEIRNQFIRNKFNQSLPKLFMREPHVTVGIHDTEKSAQEQVDIYNSKFLPRSVTINGVMID